MEFGLQDIKRIDHPTADRVGIHNKFRGAAKPGAFFFFQCCLCESAHGTFLPDDPHAGWPTKGHIKKH